MATVPATLRAIGIGATLAGLVFFTATATSASTATVERESSVEDCFKVEAGTELKWKWSSSEPLNFNIHYHLEGKTVYPVKEPGTTSGEGTLILEETKKLCLMWRNSELSDISLNWTRQPPPE